MLPSNKRIKKTALPSDVLHPVMRRFCERLYSMKIWTLLFLLAFSKFAFGQEEVKFYTTTTHLYWCYEKEVPEDLSDIDRVFGFPHPQNVSNDGYKKGLASVKITDVDQELLIIFPTTIKVEGNVTKSSTKSSKGDCNSIKEME